MLQLNTRKPEKRKSSGWQKEYDSGKKNPEWEKDYKKVYFCWGRRLAEQTGENPPRLEGGYEQGEESGSY